MIAERLVDQEEVEVINLELLEKRSRNTASPSPLLDARPRGMMNSSSRAMHSP